MSKSIPFGSVVAWLFATAALHAQSVLYVDRDATGPANGSSWCNAYRNLQDALASASGAVNEIHIANGTYRPDQGAGQTAGDRLATFRLVDRVELMGGYAGCGAADPNARDSALFETILNGDLAGNDGPNFANYAENSYHVVTYDDPTAVAVVLDGFTISGGNADGEHDAALDQGGAIHIRNGTVKCITGGPTIRNCLVRDNWAAHHGAVNDHAWSSVFESCTFRNNVAGHEGAGLLVHAGSAVVSNCLFEGNSVGFTVNRGEGGGAWVGHDADPTCPAQHQTVFTECVFRGNHTRHRGGGAFGAQTSAPRFIGCTFDDNTSDFLGGGAYMDAAHTDAPSTFISCTFSDNTAAAAGGGAFAPRGSFTDCTFTHNSAPTGGGIYVVTPGPLFVQSSIFIGNVAVGDTGGGGGIYVAADGTIRNCVFRGNVTDFNGGGVYNLGNELTVTDSTFIDNEARLGGGILMYFGDAQQLTDCRFRGNTALTGGGVYTVGSPTTLVNCEFSGNQATDLGGGILLNYDNLWMINCTVHGNTATQGGGMWTSFGAAPNTIGSIYIDNSILWGNSDNAGSGQRSQIYEDSTAQEVLINYSDVQGWNGSLDGANTINVNPLFVDPDGADDVAGTDDDNLRLSGTSDCIDAGDNGVVPPGVTTDLDGRPRIENGTVDMGPYERGGCGDGDCSSPENPCNCSEDCGPPPVSESACNDGDDNDCDGLTDCSDPSCADDPGCPQPCLCFANVNDEITTPPVTILDVTAVAECAAGDCSRCVRSCDINCDGGVDFEDLGSVICHFNAGTESGMDCCELPSGACYDASGFGDCVITSQDACSLFGGTYDGDDSTCGCLGTLLLYADVNDSGAVNFSDIALIVEVFRGIVTTITFDDADIFPCGGNDTVNFQDISASVAAFRGLPPCPNLCF